MPDEEFRRRIASRMFPENQQENKHDKYRPHPHFEPDFNSPNSQLFGHWRNETPCNLSSNGLFVLGEDINPT